MSLIKQLGRSYRLKQLRNKLYNTFVIAGLYESVKWHDTKIERYPYILNIQDKKEKTVYVFRLPHGVNPQDIEKKRYVFESIFGRYISFDVDVSRVILKVYPKGLQTRLNYNYSDILQSIKKQRLPIVCGHSLEGHIHTLDMVKHPHILISGETGSGKSSELRSILTTLVKTRTPEQLQLVLGDLKRSEFHVFKRINHVEGVYHSADELRPTLKRIKQEMASRGNKLDEEEVNSIDELKDKIPYIMVCIDEVALLRKEDDIMDILEEISSIGRSLGVFIIISMQRPDSKLLDGKLKVNLTIRMGFQTADEINSKIIGTPGAENITNPGRMILKVNSSIQEIQCPWLDNDKAKKMLDPYKVKDVGTNDIPIDKSKSKYDEILELMNDEA